MEEEEDEDEDEDEEMIWLVCLSLLNLTISQLNIDWTSDRYIHFRVDRTYLRDKERDRALVRCWILVACTVLSCNPLLLAFNAWCAQLEMHHASFENWFPAPRFLLPHLGFYSRTLVSSV
jgi:hypothetical protein